MIERIRLLKKLSKWFRPYIQWTSSERHIKCLQVWVLFFGTYLEQTNNVYVLSIIHFQRYFKMSLLFHESLHSRTVDSISL